MPTTDDGRAELRFASTAEVHPQDEADRVEKVAQHLQAQFGDLARASAAARPPSALFGGAPNDPTVFARWV